MENSRDYTRSVVHQFMNEVIEPGFHELVNRPQESTRLNILIQTATHRLGEQLHRIDHHDFQEGSKELQDYWHSIAFTAERESLEMLSEIQRIQQQYNPRLKRV
ncbi:MAG: hypothetical protein ACK5BL_09165 [Flavobacteriales bacterium]